MTKRLISIALSLAFLLSSVFFYTDVSTAQAAGDTPYVAFFLEGPSETLNADTFEVTLSAAVPEGLPGGGIGGINLDLNFVTRYLSVKSLTKGEYFDKADFSLQTAEGLRFLYEDINTAVPAGLHELFTVKFKIAEYTPKDIEFNFFVEVTDLYDATVISGDIPAITDTAILGVFHGERFEVIPNEAHIYVGDTIQLFANKSINYVQNSNQNILFYENGFVTGLKPGQGQLSFFSDTGENTLVRIFVEEESARLSALTLFNAKLSPDFDMDCFTYTAVIPQEDEQLKFRYKTFDSNATVKIDNPTIPIGETKNVTFDITSSDRMQHFVYTIAVTRETVSHNSNLASLSVEQGQLSPDFAPSIYEYEVTVPYEVTAPKIHAVPANPNADVKIDIPSSIIFGVPAEAKITVTAQDGVTKKEYIVTIKREAPSSNADLSSLTVSGVTLSPEFDPAKLFYSGGTVPYSVKSLQVEAVAADENSAVMIEGNTNLAVGENKIKITVTAQSGTYKVYTISVTRAAPSNNERLSSLTVSGVTLSPAFSPTVYDYSAAVPYEKDKEVTVAWTTEDENATVTCDTPKKMLVPGQNGITVTVTAENGSKRTYTISITMSAPSANCNLQSLTVSGVTISPAFSPDALAYTAAVPYTVDKVSVRYQVADKTATAVLVNPALVVGTNKITVTVTAQDGETQKVYTITVTRAAPSKNARLSSLALSGVAISPSFLPDTEAYTASVPYNTDKVAVTYKTEDGNAKVAVNNPTLAAGKTTKVTVTVTAQDGKTTKVYTISVSRPNPPYPSTITSAKYTIRGGYISKIAAGTTASTLLNGINDRQYIKIYRANGTAAGNNDVVGTGFTVRLVINGATKQTLTVVVTGDVNGDSLIDITDFLQIKAVLLKKNTFSNAAKQAADINGDNTVDITDFLQVKAHLLKKGSIRPR